MAFGHRRKPRDKNVYARMDARTRALLIALVAEEEETMSSIIRRAVRDFARRNLPAETREKLRARAA